jgi:hypothetical protein
VATAIFFDLIVVIDTGAYDLAVLLDIAADYTTRTILPPKFRLVLCKTFYHKLNHLIIRI